MVGQPCRAVSEPLKPTPTTNTDVSTQCVPAIRVYNSQNGLPQSAVRAIAFDQKGYLWVGTQDGTAYFNGQKWTTVNVAQRTISRFFRSILASSDGSMWFGSDNGGLSHLKNGKWEIFDVQSGFPSNTVRTMLETRTPQGNSVLWIGTDSGLVRLENGKWQVIDTSNGLPNNTVWALLEVTTLGNPQLWVGTEGGIACFDQGVWKPYTTANSGLPNNVVYCLVSTRSATGEPVIWAGTENGIGQFENGGWKLWDNPGGLSKGFIQMTLLHSTSSTGQSTLWVGSYGSGLGRFENGTWQIYNQQNGFPSDLISVLVETRSPEGHRTLWVGTYNGGLIRIESEKWQVLRTPPPLPTNVISSLFETTNAAGEPVFWAGFDSGGVARFENGQWTFFGASAGFPQQSISDFLETRSATGQTTLWAGIYGGGLARFEQGRWQFFTEQTGLPSRWVTSLAQSTDTDGKLVVWIGTFGGGLVQWKENRWQTITSATGLPHNWVWSLLVTKNREGKPMVWAGTRAGGLGCYVDGDWKRYDTRQGLPSNWVWSLHEQVLPSGQRTLWIGTSGGLSALSLDSPTPAITTTLSETSQPALPNNVVYQILEDAGHRLYLSTNKGVTRLSRASREDQSGDQFRLHTFTSEDGLPGNECLINPVNFLVDHASRLWVGTVGGLAMLDPKLEYLDRTAKPLYLERVSLLNQETGMAVDAQINQAELRHFENNLTFEFALLSYYRESETIYQSQLDGFDIVRSNWSTEAKRSYTNLPSGKYTFSVWGKDYAGNISGPVQVSFVIRPAPWQTWWFYGFVIISVGAAFVGFYRSRVTALRERQQQRLKLLYQLLESIRAINSQPDLRAILDQIAEESARLIDGEPGGIGTLETDRIVFQRLWKEGAWVDETLVFRLGEGPVGKVAQTRTSRRTTNPKEAGLETFPATAQTYFANGSLDVPILSHTKALLGVLAVRRPVGRIPFSEADQKLIESLAHQVAVAIEKAALYLEIEGKNLELEEKNLLIHESMRELEKLYQNEQEVTRSLQDLNRMKTNFIVVTSHEMRTPLTVLKGFHEVLLSEYLGLLTGAQRQSLETCQRMVDRLNANFDDILEMLKINEGATTLNVSEFDLRAVIDEIHTEVSVFLDRRHQKLMIDCPQVLDIKADRAKLQLILMEIIQNAIKFSYDSGIIFLNVAIDNHQLQVTVKDQGIGIDKSELSKIFDQFYTSADPSTHSSGRYEFGARGAGLGLSIARSYTESHGGRIWAESDGPGQGSRIQVRIPLQLNVLTSAGETASTGTSLRLTSKD